MSVLNYQTAKDWEKLVKNAIDDWHAPDELSRNALTQLRSVTQRASTAGHAAYPSVRALREIILEAIDSLRPENGTPPRVEDEADLRWMEPGWRMYGLLRLSLDLKPPVVAERVGLAQAGYFYRQFNRAASMLAEILRSQEGGPIDAAIPAVLFHPTGAVALDDPFYVERESDVQLHSAQAQPYYTYIIRGPRQCGKTSLLIRGIREAQTHFDVRAIHIDLQSAWDERPSTLADFLFLIGIQFVEELDGDPTVLDALWARPVPAKTRLETLLEKHLLPASERPVLLAIDEVERLSPAPYHDEFMGLLRSWHNRRAGNEPQWQKLSILLSISTEPYLLIDDPFQSPLNVGQIIVLQDFEAGQVAELSRRYHLALGEDELARLVGLLNGHPFLTRVALYTLATQPIRLEELEQSATKPGSPFSQHLGAQFRYVEDDPKLDRAMREIVRTGRCTDHTAGQRLLKSGLVVGSRDGFRCRCELYRRYYDPEPNP